MAIRKEEVENPMIRTIPIREPNSKGKCSCGCGESIVEGYAYVRWDNHYFNDGSCVRRYLMRHYDYEEVG